MRSWGWAVLKRGSGVHREPGGCDRVAAVLALWSEQRAQARWCEQQRATFSNLILLIAGVAVAFIAQRGIRSASLFAAVPLAVLGIFGILVTLKYHERYEYHMTRASHYLAVLADEFPQLRAKLIGDGAIEDHKDRHPRLSRLRLYQLWMTLHAGIAVTGITLTAVLLAR
jgi:hypothetical protein